MKKKEMLWLTALLLMAQGAFAVDAASVSEKKRTPQGLYLSAPEAHQMVTGDPATVLFVDVRTRPEVEFVGMTDLVDANIPYMFNNVAEWDEKKKNFGKAVNSGFLLAIEAQLKKKGLSKESPIVLMCRSGSRSAKAANLLAQSGYKNVYSVVDGFEGDKAKDGPEKGHRMVNGWKNAGLPWGYSLDRQKMYMEF